MWAIARAKFFNVKVKLWVKTHGRVQPEQGCSTLLIYGERAELV
jgi:hypothetical protein